MFPSLNNGLGLAVDQKQNQEVFLSVDESTNLDVSNNIIHVTGFSAEVTLTLPPVAECAGRVFAIKALDDASTNNVVVEDQDDARGWSDFTIVNASGGTLLLWCDGETFWVLASSGDS